MTVNPVRLATLRADRELDHIEAACRRRHPTYWRDSLDARPDGGRYL